MKVIIAGAGITGLAAANRLKELSKEKKIEISFNILESSNHIGGNISTFKENELLIEEGPDSFITTKPYGINLCKRLGLEDELIPTSAINRNTLIYLNGRLIPIPDGFILLAPTQFIPFIKSPVLSIYGKIRAIMEIFIPRAANIRDESLHSFIKRRFGKELFDNIAQPLIGGIYTSDPYRLSMKSAVPNIYELEGKYRSIILGLMKRHGNIKEGGARYSQFVTLKSGMRSLVDRLTSGFPDDTIKLNHPVKQIRTLTNTMKRWEIQTDNSKQFNSDGVILATPSYKSAEILKSFDQALSDELSKIEFASSAIIILAYQKSKINKDIRGFGFVVPVKENLNVIACSFSSEKFGKRAPENIILMRCFVGGALNEEFLNNSDNNIIETVKNEIGMIINAVDEPVFTHMRRYPKSMPQYNVGHDLLINSMKDHLSNHYGLYLAGNSYEGVGIPDCIKSGEKAAEDIVDLLIKQ